MPYYLVYPLFWRGVKAFGIERAFLATVFISVLFAAIDFAGMHNHVSNVFSLYGLWCAGALLAEWRASGRTIDISPNRFYCAVFILFACCQLAEKDATRIIIDWLCGLFLGAVMFCYQVRFSKTMVRDRMVGMLMLATLMLPMMLLAQKLPISGSRKLLEARIVLSAAAIGVFVTGRFSLRGCCTAILRPFYKAGAWSYALYIIHFPLLIFVAALLARMHLPRILLVVVTPLIVWLAKLLELNLQHVIVRWMDATLRPHTNN